MNSNVDVPLPKPPRCLPCMMTAALDELTAIDRTNRLNADHPGIFYYYGCPEGSGYHVGVAEEPIPKRVWPPEGLPRNHGPSWHGMDAS